MTSAAQSTANRRNALKSTGPKTVDGKAAVARNALQHGLTARRIVCFDEHARDFASFHDALRTDFAPAGAIEEQLVERIALCAWRLRRASRTEAALINSFSATNARVYGTELATVLDRAPAGLATLSRYEVALDRGLHRAFSLLERQQARRRGEFVPPPVTVEVAGLDSLADGILSAAKPEFCETKPISLDDFGLADAAKRTMSSP